MQGRRHGFLGAGRAKAYPKIKNSPDLVHYFLKRAYFPFNLFSFPLKRWKDRQFPGGISPGFADRRGGGRNPFVLISPHPPVATPMIICMLISSVGNKITVSQCFEWTMKQIQVSVGRTCRKISGNI